MLMRLRLVLCLPIVAAGCASDPSDTVNRSGPPPGFSTTGEWRFSALAGHAPGKATLWSHDPKATATWNPGIHSAAPVRVSFHVAVHPGNDSNATIEIVHKGQTDTRRLDVAHGESRWETLGTFEFAGRSGEFVRLVKNSPRGNLRASAVKFDILEPRDTNQVWQTLIVDDLVPHVVTVPQGPVKHGPPAHAQWELAFSDEFDGNRLDTNVWRTAKAGETWGKLLSARFPENVEVKDGLLRLVTRKESRGGKEWTSAFLGTRTFRQKYGYWEARFRYAGATGLNNAFWMNRGSLNKEEGFEIDVNEGHYPNFVNMTLHQHGLPSLSKSWPAPADLAKDFHLYAVDWSEKEIVFYFDGREVDRKPNTKAHGECPVLFSTAVISWAGPLTDALDGKSMDVDWVRVWRRKSAE